MAAMLDWTPSEFWRATWHDFESALWTVARRNLPREARRDGMVDASNASAVNGLFKSLAARAA
jgi:hypothetical protein